MPILLRHTHSWNVTPAEAIRIQKSLREHLILTDDFGAVRLVAGVDCGFEEGGTVTRAAVAVLSFPELRAVDQAVARLPTRFPYVPGLLSFRELPAVLAALESLSRLPDLILVDGQGYAHPRRLGIASHLGLLTDLPTIGVGKTRLLGTHDDPPLERGGWVPLWDQGETIGAVLRSREKVNPLFVSAGHKIGLASAVAWVMRCTTRYRLPEATRFAHKLASGPV